MSQIILPFKFTYYKGESLETLKLDLYGDFFPLKPVFTAMGMAWGKVLANISQSDYLRHINIGRGSPAVCADVDGFLKIVSKINPNRVKNKELFMYFVKFLPSAIGEYLDESKPKLTADDLEPVFETDAECCSDKDEIVFHRALNPRDLYRKELPTVGVKNPEEIDYLCRAFHAQLYKPNPENPHGEPIRRFFPIDSYKVGQLKDYANGGFYPRPEYFRRFPHLYRYHTSHEREVLRMADGSIVSTGRILRVEEGGAPWYKPEFANQMADLMILNQRVKEKQDRERFAKLVNSGEDYDLLKLIGDIDMGNLDENFYNEYGVDEE